MSSGEQEDVTSTPDVKPEDIVELVPDENNEVKVEDNDKENKSKPKRTKIKKRRHKKSDPAVNVISELLSANLSIISPEKTLKLSDIDKGEDLIRTVVVDKSSLLSESINEQLNKTFEEQEVKMKKKPRRTSKLSLNKSPRGKEVDTKGTDVGLDVKSSTPSPRSGKKFKKCSSQTNLNAFIQIKSPSNKSEAETSHESKTCDKTPSSANLESVDSKSAQTDCDVIEIIEETSPEKYPSTPKKNAFAFMMNARHKSIGQNSPGKTMESSPSVDSTSKKEKLSARREKFKEWSKKKGSNKRKLDEDARAEYVSNVLESRAKRMKEMLSIDLDETSKVNEIEENDLKSNRNGKSTIKAAKPKRVKSEEEKRLKIEEPLIIEETTDGEAFKKHAAIDTSNVTSNKVQKGLLSFFGVLKKEKKLPDDERTIEIESDDDAGGKRNDLIKIKMFSPQVMKQRKEMKLRMLEVEGSPRKLDRKKKRRKLETEMKAVKINDTESKSEVKIIETASNLEANISESKSNAKAVEMKAEMKIIDTESKLEVKIIETASNLEVNISESKSIAKAVEMKAEMKIIDTELKSEVKIIETASNLEVKKSESKSNVKEVATVNSSSAIEATVKRKRGRPKKVDTKSVSKIKIVAEETDAVKVEAVQNGDSSSVNTTSAKSFDDDSISVKDDSNSLTLPASVKSFDDNSDSINPVTVSVKTFNDDSSSVNLALTSSVGTSDVDVNSVSPIVPIVLGTIPEESNSIDFLQETKFKRKKLHVIEDSTSVDSFDSNKKFIDSDSNSVNSYETSKTVKKRKTSTNILSGSDSNSSISLSTMRSRIRAKVTDSNLDCEQSNSVDSIEFVTEKTKKSSRKLKKFSSFTEEIIIIDGDEAFDISSPVRRSRRSKITKNYDEMDSVDVEKKKKGESTKKLAPVFAKSSPKPKIDPAVLEARLAFLHSGVPSTLKKVIEKQASLETVTFEVFPSVSHVQQKTDSHFWNLPEAELKLNLTADNSPVAYRIFESRTVPHVSKPFELLPISKLISKQALLCMAENTDYPVIEKYRELLKPLKKLKKRRSKKRTSQEVNPLEFVMWTDKFKPKSSEDLIGNEMCVSELKKWLRSWVQYGKEMKNDRKRIRRISSDFESDEISDSVKSPGNTIVLRGPLGSGKTSSVYAICNELSIDVIELNASSKRTGKRLLQELQEATRSQQIRHETDQKLAAFVANEKSAKMCLLLIEDVDIVFKQDDGFIGALWQLLSTSKRPVVLVTNDPDCAHLQKFVSQYPALDFDARPSKAASGWLQTLCLSEGLFVNRTSLDELLVRNKKDIRKTLLDLQFWVTTGGDRQPEIKHETSKPNDDLNLHELSFNDETTFFIHEKRNSSTYPIRLEQTWRNISRLLDERGTKDNLKELENISSLYDSLSLCDVMLRDVPCDSLEPCHTWWKEIPKDGLSLDENLNEYKSGESVSHEIVNGLIETSWKLNRSDPRYPIDITSPTDEDIRWRTDRHHCELIYLESCSANFQTDRSSFTTDYFPMLRHITRTEHERASLNKKRGNRFYNYLRTVNFNLDKSVMKTARNMFRNE